MLQIFFNNLYTPTATELCYYIVIIPDQRRGVCFAYIMDDMCSGLAFDANMVTMDACCCNGGMAWGQNCELCPTFGSSKQ